MKIKQTLTSIALIGALALSSAGCSKDHSQYEYSWKIGEDKVIFEENSNLSGIVYDDNILTIIKPDGRIIRNLDYWGDDLKFEYVEITDKNKNTVRYTYNSEVGKPVLEEAQKQANVYLRKILEKKGNKKQDRINREIKQGLENLK